jgi:hypothetical protein
VSGISATDHQALSNRTALNSHPVGAISGVTGGSIPFVDATTLALTETADLTLGASALWNKRFTVLGDNAVGIKMKYLTGTTAAAEGGATSIAHGVTGTKIVDFSVKVENGVGSGLQSEYTGVAGYQYHVYHDPTSINVVLHASNSENILEKPIIAIVWYVE